MRYFEEPEEKEHECPVCGCSVETPGICSSRACLIVDNEQ